MLNPARQTIRGLGGKTIAPTGLKWAGIAALETLIHCSPYSIDRIVAVNYMNGHLVGLDSSGVETGPAKWIGTHALGARLHSAPFGAQTVLVVSSTRQTAFDVDSSGVNSDSCKWVGVAELGDRLYTAPLTVHEILVVIPETLSVTAPVISKSRQKKLAETVSQRCAVASTALLNRLTNFGLVHSRTGCGELFASCGALFVRVSSDKNGFLPVSMLSFWMGELAMPLLWYLGKAYMRECNDPKELVPTMTCTQQAITLMIGIERYLRLLACQPLFV